MKLKYSSIILCLILLISINSTFAVDASTENSYVVPINHESKINENASFYIQSLSMIDDVLLSDRFTEWIKNTCLTPECKFTVINPDVAPESGENIIKIYTKTQKIYFSILPGESAERSNKYMGNLRTPATQFAIINQCGQTIKDIRVVFFRHIPYTPLPVPASWSSRQYLANGGQISYNPDPSFASVTIGVQLMNGQCTTKILEPLGGWHQAIIKKNRAPYIDFR